MTKDEVKSLWEQVKDNQRRLRECLGPHDFGFDPDAPASTLKKRYRCSKCGGEVPATDLVMYLQGLDHGRRSAS